MKEEFLHYLWKYRLYDTDSLIDENGEKIKVISPGEYNRDSGPDFFNARIRIGSTEWAGNVEIHLLSSHFFQHGHHIDPAYDNVILHVVAKNDRQVFNSRNAEIITSEISYDNSLYERYLDLVNNPLSIACQSDLKYVDQFRISSWLARLAAERLEMKSDRIAEIYLSTGNDWDETLYRLISRYFGFRVNTDPFEMLVTALPSRILLKHSDSRFQSEALLYGTAGMLEEGLFPGAIADEYYRSLVKEYKILRTKYSLKPVDGWVWKFSRLRPSNFPTVRLSQLAEMLRTSGGLFSRLIESGTLEEIRKILEVKASEYWDNHYVFGKETRNRGKRTGDIAADMLLINAVIPILFCYGRKRNDQSMTDRALEMLENLPPEDNIIIRDWTKAGIDGGSAFRTQALLQLRTQYCNRRHCLDCAIGSVLISGGKALRRNDELALES